MKKNKIFCSECKGEVVIHNGQYVCSRCGLVIGPQYLPPIADFTSTEDSLGISSKQYVSLGSRVHIVDGLGSYIDYHTTSFFKDSHGESLVPFKQRLFRRLKYMYDLRTRISGNETNYRALRTLNRACSILQLPDSVRDRAAYYYQKISKKYGKLKEDSTNHIVLVAACLLLAIREYKHRAPVAIKELIEVFKNMGHRVSVRRVVREVAVIKKVIGTKNYVRKSEDYIYRIISAIINSKDVLMQLQSLDIPYNHFKRLLLKETLQILRGLNFSLRKGRNPYILAVASVYAAAKKISFQLGIKRILTQKLVARLSGVAEYSVRDHYCSLLKKIIEKQGDNKLEARSIQ